MIRRNVLIGGGVLAAATGLGYSLLHSRSINLSDLSGRTKLVMPSLLDATRTGKIPLVAQAGETIFGKGKPSATLGYNQSYLGPVVKVRNGGYQANISNTTGQPITVHWHGLLVPSYADGGPHQVVNPGERWSPEFEIKQSPSTPWFHTHVHGQTSIGVYAGLAGGMIVSDGLDDQRELPSNYGEDDLYLVLQDRSFDRRGRLSYNLGMMGGMHGFSGDVIVVNGQINAVANVPKGIVRLRLLNGSNARIYRLGLSDQRSMHLIATDGGYLPKPIALDVLSLSPGERAEVLVDFSNGNPVALMSLPDPNSGVGGMMGRFQNLAAQTLGSEFEIIPFAVDERLPVRISRLPDKLDGEIPDLNGENVKKRSFVLNLGMGGGMMGGGMMSGGGMGINGRPFEMSRVDLAVMAGTVERWNVSAGNLAHPFHVHGVFFQVVSENGGNTRPENTGWKDTVLVNQSVELLVKFNDVTAPNSPFMYHCHILEHEDQGMMGQFTIV